jgi:predicted nucleic acid-binding protein
MIFVDTSAWLALADRHDRNHASAVEVGQRVARGDFGKQVTTNYVAAETTSLVRRRLGLPAALSLAKLFGESAEIRVFWIEPVHHAEAIRLLATHPDNQWSLIGCTSFVVMRALQIGSAFALDEDFARAGFAVFPKAPE